MDYRIYYEIVYLCNKMKPVKNLFSKILSLVKREDNQFTKDLLLFGMAIVAFLLLIATFN